MLEGVILDNTERLLSQSPYFAAFPKHTVMHGDSAATSLHCSDGMLYNPVLDIFHAYNNVASPGMIRVAPDNFATAAAAVAVSETSTNILEMALEPGGTGRVWGYRKDSAGQDGLWLRTNAVAGTWSKIIGATNNDTQHIYRKTNGELWYNNSTAGNWYQLQNGAVGNAQTTPPTGLMNAAYGLYGYYKFPSSIAVAQYGFGGSHFNYFAISPVRRIDAFSATPGYMFDTYTIAGADALVLWDNAWTGGSPVYATNAICRLPSELVLYGAPAAQVATNRATSQLIEVSDTYTLALVQYSKGFNDAVNTPYQAMNYPRFATTESPYKTYNRVSMALLNRVSRVAKFIGYVDLPAYREAAVGPTTNEGPLAAVVRGARLTDGTIHLLSDGVIGTSYSTSANVNGLLLTEIPLLKLDF